VRNRNFVVIDDAALPLRAGRRPHFGDDGVEGVGVRADRAGQGVAAERAEANPHHPRRLAGQKGQTFVIDHDQRAIALHDRALFGEVQRHDRNIFRPDVLPDIELGPIRQRKYPHGFAGLDAGIEQPPQLGTLIAWIPGVIGRTMREDALLRSALLLVAPRPAEGGVETPFVQGLAQGLGLHHLRVDRRAGSDRRNAGGEPAFVDVNEQVHAHPRRGLIAKGEHLAKFPRRIDMQQGKRRLSRKERLLRHVQHDAGILADRIEHDRFGKLGHGFAHDVDRLRLKPAQARREEGRFHLPRIGQHLPVNLKKAMNYPSS
jgi:hypothetical protein